MKNKDISLQSEIFTRGVEDIITPEELEKLLKSGKPLRIKHGIDATSSDLHVGHAASLWKIKALQEAGHKAVILLGDTTTRIGDPTGKSKTRPVLDPGTISANVRAIEKQIKKILFATPALLEIRKNSEWYTRMRVPEFLGLLSHVTHARLVERDMFRQRIAAGAEIFAHEFVYPVLQGYDSVMLKADLTIIGSDQLFNEHMGRFFQERQNSTPQVIVTLKILPGLDGGEKMSKSLGNYIGLLDTPQDKFGKAMRLLDSLLVAYLEAYTDVSIDTIKGIQKSLVKGDNPKDIKMFFAEALVRRYHGEKCAQEERRRFCDLFSHHTIREDIPSRRIAYILWDILTLLQTLGLVSSKSEARNLIRQHAVEIDSLIIKSSRARIHVRKGMIVKVGKRRLLRIN